MIENFLYLIKQYGFVPQANRIYNSQVSHPPLLSCMISFYIEATNDTELVKRAVPLLDFEFKNQFAKNTVTVNGYKLYVYGNVVRGPRPEKYREDITLASFLTNVTDKENLYAELRAAGESSFDYSSRWIIKNGENIGSLADTKCRSIIPVDLNSIIYRNLKKISLFYQNVGDTNKADEYAQRASDLQVAIQAILWNEEDGIWYDYDLINKKPRKYFVITNFSPLGSYAFNESDVTKLSTSIMKYINDKNLDSFMGGIPTTLTVSDDDWDFPNAWAQHQWMVIVGLMNLNVSVTTQLAQKWALRWLNNNYLACKRDGVMYNKVSEINKSNNG